MEVSEIKKKVVEEVNCILNGSLPNEHFVELVIDRLESFTYVIKEDDAFIICFNIQKIINTIKNMCNITSLPDGLIYIAVDMVCGEFIFNKKQTNSLGDEFDLDSALESVKLGDATVAFTGATDEQKLNMLIDHLMNNGKSEFICYRRIKW